MKIGVSAYSYSRYMRQTGADEFAAAQLAKEQGFDGIEFLPLKKRPQDATLMDTALALRAHCDALSLPICAYTVDADFLSGRNVDPKDEPQRLMGCVDICKALGASVMRHDTAWGLPDHIPSWKEAIPVVAPAIRRVTEYAAAQGVRTCTENHGFLFQDSDRIKALIEAVNHPNFGWLVDMGNFACADEPNLSAVKTAAPYAFHVHAKDFFIRQPQEGEKAPDGYFVSRGGKFLCGTIVGRGDVPVLDCIKALKASGYDGWLSLEFEGQEDNLSATREGLAFLRKAIEG